MTQTVTTTGTGASAAIYLSQGLWSLAISSSSWGAAEIQHSDINQVVWDDLKPSEAEDPIALTANRVLIVRGGLSYRLNVSSHAAAITMLATRMNR